MARPLTLLTLAAATALLAGCETMSEDQCRKADWYQKGLSDGRDGWSDTHVDAHRKACAKAGVAPDDRQWRRGWAEGVASFCVPRVAWRLGVNNRTYYGGCRDLNEADWMRWYRLGQDAYRTRSEREAKQREIDKLEEQLKKAQKDDERKTLREKIRQLDEEQSRLRRLLDMQMRNEPR